MRFPLLIVALLSNVHSAMAQRQGVAPVGFDEDSLLVVSQKPRRKLKKNDKKYVERRNENPSVVKDETVDVKEENEDGENREVVPNEPSNFPSPSVDARDETPSSDNSQSPTSAAVPTGGGAMMPTRPDIKKRQKSRSDKKMSKISKNKKSTGKGKGKGGSSTKSVKGKKGKGKGKGSSGGMGMNGPNCMSAVAETLKNVIPDVITKNPSLCCDFDGPIGVYVTHAQPNNSTFSGFEPFWDRIYEQVDRLSALTDVCFVMTGYDPTSDRELTDIITDATVLASSLPETTAMMVTDPTDNLVLMNEVRYIVNDATLPSIGVFNSGYDNIVIESLVSGQDRIPYIGFMNDADFGTDAARFTKNLLDGVTAVPVCFNGRPDLEFVGERCSSYYTELSSNVNPVTGVECSIESTVQDIFQVLVDAGANAVYSHVDCCAVVAEAVAMARSMGQSIVAVGCQDEDLSAGAVDFVTTQPILLQANSPATWVNFPVRQELQGRDGRGEMYFPSTSSLVNTAIYTVPIM